LISSLILDFRIHFSSNSLPHSVQLNFSGLFLLMTFIFLLHSGHFIITPLGFSSFSRVSCLDRGVGRGLAFPRRKLILLRTRSGTGRADRLDQVFHHEWAHVALDHAVSFRPLPRWFKEGFAIFQSGEWSFGRVRALAGGVVSNRLFSLETLGEQFPKSPLEVELAYAQSIDFVSFLLGEYGRAPFHRLIQLLRADWPFFLAVEEAYDDGLFSIEEAWHQDLKMRFTWIPLLTGTAVLWFAATLIFIAAYLKKRRHKHLGLLAMDAGTGSGANDDDEPPPPLTPHSP